jgi:hypothetical protein
MCLTVSQIFAENCTVSPARTLASPGVTVIDDGRKYRGEDDGSAAPAAPQT